MKELFALTLLRLVNLQFSTTKGMNPNYIGLVNDAGNTIYLSVEADCVNICAFKVSKQCFNKSISDISQLEDVIDQLKLKVKCNDNTI